MKNEIISLITTVIAGVLHYSDIGELPSRFEAITLCLVIYLYMEHKS